MKQIERKQKLIIISFITLIIGIIITASIIGNLMRPKSSDVEPKGIRLSVINDPSDSIAISWYTEAKASDPKVRYSLNPDLSDSEEVV